MRRTASVASVGMMFLVLVAATAAPPEKVAAEEDRYAREPEADVVEDVASDWWFAIDATFNGKYVWRGINVTDDHVFQPSVTAGYKGFSVNVWGNRDLTGVNGMAGDFNEIDFTVDYSWQQDVLAMSVGAIRYTFPHGGPASTTELYGSIGADVLLSPTLTLYVDADEADGAYATFAIGHSFDDVATLAEGVSMSVDLGAGIGFGTANYNDFYFGEDESAINDLLLTLELPIDLGKGWSVTPAASFSALLDEDIRDSMSEQSNFWGGMTLSYVF